MAKEKRASKQLIAGGYGFIACGLAMLATIGGRSVSPYRSASITENWLPVIVFSLGLIMAICGHVKLTKEKAAANEPSALEEPLATDSDSIEADDTNP